MRRNTRPARRFIFEHLEDRVNPSLVPFAVETITTTADAVLSVHAADLDGDGDVDALGASRNDGAVRWYENGGSGSFTERTIDNTLSGPGFVSAVDLDVDGDRDVLVTDFVADTVYWYENDGSQTFGAASRTTILAGNILDLPKEVHAADFDRDGDLDVVVVDALNNRLVALENLGNEFFSNQVNIALNGAETAVVGDFDRDGQLGLVFGSSSTGEIRGITGGISGTIEPNAGSISHLAAADADGDGDLDFFAAAAGLENRVYLYRNDGTGTFTRLDVATTISSPQSVFPADLDGDGDVDVAVASRNDDTIAWYDNNGSLTFTHRVLATDANAAQSVYVADMDRDGDPDVLAASEFDDTVRLLRNDAIHRSATFPIGETLTTTVENPRTVATGDLNGDGAPDAVVGSFTDDTIRWYRNDGGGSLSEQATAVSAAATQVNDVGIADVSQDGIPDVYAGLGNRVVWYENDGAGGFTERLVGAITGTVSVDVGDYNNDSHPDFVAIETVTGAVQLFESNGFASWDAPVSFADLNSTTVRFADMNRDGKLDIVLDDNLSGGRVVYLEQLAFGGIAFRTVGDATQVRSIHIADAGRDGDLDVFTASFNGDTVYFFENDGTQTFTRQTAIPNADGAVAVVGGDLDRDGDHDLIGGSFNDGSVRYAQFSNPAFFPELVSNKLANVNDLALADFNGDGALDLIAVAGNKALSSTPQVVVFQNRGGQYALTTTDIAPTQAAGGTEVPLLSPTLAHRGRVGDSNVDLTSLRLRFESGTGTPLTSTQADNLIETLRVYRGTNGNGTFDAGTDIAVATVGTLTLNAFGETNVMITGNGTVNAPGAGDTEATFFVVAELTPNADQTTPNTFRVTLDSSDTTAVNAAAGNPLQVAFSPDVTSTAVTATDVSAPNPPVVTAINVDSGTSATDGVTNDNTLTVQGTAGPNTTVELFRNGASVGTTTASGAGTWSIADPTALADGTYAYTATAADAAGNTSAPSTAFTVTVDRLAPDAPIITLIADDTGPDGSDGVTSDQTLLVGGTAEPNAIVRLFRDGAIVGTTTANNVGSWSLADPTTLADGKYQYTAQATDLAGNTSIPSTPFTVTVDTTLLDVTITGIEDDTGQDKTDGITSDNTLLVLGTAAPGAEVELFRDTKSVGTTTADTSGQWTFDGTDTKLDDGTYQFKAVAVSTTGRTSETKSPFEATVDTKPPVVTIDPRRGSSRTPTLTGTVDDPDAIVVVTVGDKAATATNNGDGTWTLDGSKLASEVGPLGTGVTDVEVTATDVAGNTGTDDTEGEVTVGAVTAATTGLFAVGAGAGGPATVTVYNPDGSTAQTITAFPGFTGGVRTAVADVTGDGTPDVVVGTGPGGPTQVRVIDGETGAELFSLQPFEPTFTGGVYVAAGDMTGDGKAEVVITPDEGGGPRVRVFSGDGFGLLADFLGIEDPNFRGGARAALADINGDGISDLLVAAGFGGGPRLAVFDGTSIGGGNTPVKLFADLFVFEDSLRNGAFIAGGDVDGDGKADVVAGGGPGGGPRVFVLSGADLMGNQQVPVANFFAGDLENRGGIRVAVKNLDGDEFADIVTGSGTDGGSRVTGYLGTNAQPNGTPPVELALDAFAGFNGGVFVG